MIFLRQNNLITETLHGYKNFLQYCKDVGKKSVDELDSEDFIAYRSEYSAPREQVELIKNLLGFSQLPHT